MNFTNITKEIMLKQIILWLVIAWIGWVIIYYSVWISEAFGRVVWFENNLWWTKNGYVLIWFGFIVIGFLILFWVIPLWSPVQTIWTVGV